MRVFVDSSVCRGHGECEFIAPEVFRIGDRGYVEVLAQPDEEMREKMQLAAQSCPEGAIAVVG